MLGVKLKPKFTKSDALEINKYFKRDDPDAVKYADFNSDDLSALEEESLAPYEVT